MANATTNAATRTRANNSLDHYHKVFREGLSQNLTPASFLAAAVVRELRSQGVDVKHRLDAINESIAKALGSGQVGDGMKFPLETGDPSIDDRDISLKLEDSDFRDAAEHFEKAIKDSTYKYGFVENR